MALTTAGYGCLGGGERCVGAPVKEALGWWGESGETWGAAEERAEGAD